MIKEINLIGLIGSLEGGSTKPLMIDGEDENGEIQRYVVKLYKQEYNTQYFVVAKEIITSELAKEFDLPVPEYRIINFDNKLLEELGEYNQKQIEQIQNGYKFCTKLEDAYILFNPNFKNNFLKNYEIETLFAFDNFIINPDRGGWRNKPNLLISDEDFLLIDHEQSFSFYQTKINSAKLSYNKSFSSYDYTKHIFYNKLKKRKVNTNVFDDFDYSLKNLNISIFKNLLKQIESLNIDCGEKNIIFAYLEWCKQNHTYIKKKLLERIQ